MSVSLPTVPLNITCKYKSVIPTGIGLSVKSNVNTVGVVELSDDMVIGADTE